MHYFTMAVFCHEPPTVTRHFHVSFLVGDDWNVYEGRGWYVTPEKTNELERYHAKYYEVVFIGDMRREFQLIVIMHWY